MVQSVPHLPVENAARRRSPRWYDTDWLVLSRLYRAIAAMAETQIQSGATAIDFGCGSRPYAHLVRARGAVYLGAELDQSGDLAIGRNGRVEAADGSADVLLSFQVLEHVRDLDAYLGEARRLLKADGRMILSTHGTWLYHPHPEDHRRWTREGLKGDVESRGFELIECVPVVGPLAWTTLIRLTSFAFALRAMPLVGRVFAGALALVMNARAVLEDWVTPDWVTRENACVYLILCRPS
jgi:SAM-dependent methyltransferase